MEEDKQQVVICDEQLEPKPATKDAAAEEGVHERQQWGNKWEFFLVLAGYAIGIGNLWR